MKIAFVAVAAFCLRVDAQQDAVLPTPRQLAWQAREVEALIHFGINTFTGREWGGGQEDPGSFNPPDIDARQWISAAKLFGAKTVIFTAKHHDGFCLWPTATTDFSVKRSPWRGGGGDVVREVADACREAGIGFGVYLSPSDLHEPSFGWNSAKYNDFFCEQLRELLTNYGEVCQVFFDGANPGPRQQKFDWQRFYALIRELQPNAVISIRGPDVRWVGNEVGEARQSEWSVVPLPVAADRHDWQDMVSGDLGSRGRVKDANHLHWYPAVADVSLRRTWFWAPGTDNSLKSVDELVRIYERSVGRNAGLQLSIAPDRSGRIPERDLARLKEFGDTIATYFSRNLCMDPGVLTEEAHGPLGPSWTAGFSAPKPIRYVVLQENISKGQHVEELEVKVKRANGEEIVRRVTTVGWKRILKMEAPDAIEVRVEVQQSRAVPDLKVAVY